MPVLVTNDIPVPFSLNFVREFSVDIVKKSTADPETGIPRTVFNPIITLYSEQVPDDIYFSIYPEAEVNITRFNLISEIFELDKNKAIAQAYLSMSYLSLKYFEEVRIINEEGVVEETLNMTEIVNQVFPGEGVFLFP